VTLFIVVGAIVGNSLDIVGCILVTLAAIARVSAAFGEGWTMPLLVASACFWIGAFGVFVLCYGPILFLPRGSN